MSSSPRSSEESVVLIVDSLPLRNLGFVSILDRLSPGRRFKVASLTPGEAEKWIRSQGNCSMIIYNVGGASIADHKHLKRIRSLLRARSADTPLVVFSDNNERKEVLAALNTGAQGFLYAGTELHLAQQALSFILEGGSYFPAAQARRGRQVNALLSINRTSGPELPALAPPGNVNEAPPAAAWANMDLTGRQKAVLERLSRGDSNKAIARQLGIREGTVKVHVRQIMRKLGVANRTQVAIACAGGTTIDGGADEPRGKPKIETSSSDGGLDLSYPDVLGGSRRLMS